MLDPNIILQAGQINDPMKTLSGMQGALQVRDMMQKQQIHQQLRELAAQSDLSTPEGTNAYLAQYAKYDPIGSIKARTDYNKGTQEVAKAGHEAASAKLAFQRSINLFDKDEQSQLLDMTQRTGSAAMAASQVKDPVQRKAAWGQHLAQISQMYQPSPTDSPRMAAAKQNILAQLQQEGQALEGMPPEQVDALLQKHWNDSKTHADWIAETKPQPQKWSGPHAGILPNGKPGFFRQDPVTGETQEVPGGFKPIPQAAIVLDNRNRSDLANDYTNHPLYAQAKSISDLKQGLPMRQGKDAATLNTLIAKIRQDEGKQPYDAGEWTRVKRSREYFSGNGKGAETLTSNDILLGHADEVLDSLQGANLDNTRVLNTINQWIARQTGQDAQYKDLKVASKVFGSELANMLREHDAGEKKATHDLFDSVDSPASFRSAVMKAKQMAATRSAGLANQWFRETNIDPVEAGILPDRVARAAVDAPAARGYTWASKYRSGGNTTPDAAPQLVTEATAKPEKGPSGKLLTPKDAARVQNLRNGGMSEDRIQAALKKMGY